MNTTKLKLESAERMTLAARVATVAPVGFDGAIVEIECDTSNGLPGITLVGMGNKAVDEAKERIRSAISNSGLQMPRKRITLNLAPADLPKVGSSYDLPLALAILLVSKQLPSGCLDKTIVVGELALDGRLRSTRGNIIFAEAARRQGYTKLIMPVEGSEQAALVDGVEVIAVASLRDLYRYLAGVLSIKPIVASTPSVGAHFGIDMGDVVGQQLAKRSLEVAAAGQHNVMLYGPPGTGKSMLAKALVSILPALSRKEVIEVTKIHNIAGVQSQSLVLSRPFRAPHHSTSHIALIGGGRLATPGEVSLAHNGVLFLDEMPEFGRQALESLRQPLEDGQVVIARAEQTARYPARCMLVATRNPCPCGYFGDQQKACTCSPSAIASYQTKISGPLLDRIDMSIRVERILHEQLLMTGYTSESSKQIAARVAVARSIQLRRQSGYNAHLSTKQLKKLPISRDAKLLLNSAADRLLLSPRGYMRVMRVAQTIADLSNAPEITKSAIAEAIQYRGLSSPQGV